MLTEENAQQIIAQNLANASTTGYKQEIPHFESFAENLVAQAGVTGVDDSGSLGSLGSGGQMDDAYTDFSDGPLQRTGNNLDVALRGNAFLTVQTAQGVRYTRDGALCLTSTGALAEVGNGALILSDQGQPIQLPQGARTTSIQPDGSVFADGKSVGKLGLVALSAGSQATRVGDNLWQAAQPQSVAAGGSSGIEVEPGFLEASNVNIVKEMVTMIACTRAYEANQKALQAHDSVQDHAVNEVGRVA